MSETTDATHITFPTSRAIPALLTRIRIPESALAPNEFLDASFQGSTFFSAIGESIHLR